MTDETLKGLYKFCEEKSKNIKLKAEPQVFIELCNALEELKFLRTAKETMYREIYNKAIDDFKNILNEYFHKQNNPKSKFRPSIVLTERDAINIIEQLKVGVENDD